MAAHQCLRCRSALRQANHIRQTLKTCKRQTHSSTTSLGKASTTPSVNESTAPSPEASPKTKLNITKLLSKPTWSVRSLLPPASDTSNTSSPSSSSAPSGETITPTQLHHLLRLSALPQPRSQAEEATMLETLHTQLHFVRAIQAVDTTGVEPLVTIRDETPEGIQELTVGLENPRIKEALGREEKVGRMGRVRRRRDGEIEDRRSLEEKEWDPLKGTEGRTVGRHFVVESGKSVGLGIEGAKEKETGET